MPAATMPAKSRAILLIGLASGLAGLFIFLGKGDPTDGRTIPPTEGDPHTGHPTAAANPDEEALPSKSKSRSPTPKISKARTLALLETPIPGPVELPEQRLPDRVEALNQILAATGISADQVRIEIHASLDKWQHLLCQQLTLADFTPRQMLQYTAGITRLCFHVEEAVVFIYDCGTSPFDKEPAIPEESDFLE